MKKSVILLFALILTLGLIGCSKKSEVKDIPVSDIKSAINTESLLPIQPIADIDAKEFHAFENVKDKIKEGFVIQALINVKLQDVFVVKTDDVDSVKKAIEDYKSNSLKLFGDGYGGEENVDAVNNSILESKGNYVYFIATKKAKDIESKILEIIE